MKSDILIEAPDNLRGLKRDEIVEGLRTRLRGRAIEAYIYGSFLTKDFSRHSDIDLIIVAETDIPFVERGLEFSDLREWLPAIEPLVYTPGEFERLTGDPSIGFWRSVVGTMRKIL